MDNRGTSDTPARRDTERASPSPGRACWCWSGEHGRGRRRGRLVVVRRPGQRPRRPARPAWFEDLVQLIVHGTGPEDRIAGMVHARMEDDGGIEFRYRVYRRRDLYRCESLHGAVHAIAGQDARGVRREDRPRMWSGPRGRFVVSTTITTSARRGRSGTRSANEAAVGQLRRPLPAPSCKGLGLTAQLSARSTVRVWPGEMSSCALARLLAARRMGAEGASGDAARPPGRDV